MRVPRPKKAQTFVEYTMLIGIMITVLVAMTPLVRRSIQSLVKVVADRVGNQAAADQLGGKFGYLNSSNIYTDRDYRMQRRERIGSTEYQYLTDETVTGRSSVSNQGFTERVDF